MDEVDLDWVPDYSRQKDKSGTVTSGSKIASTSIASKGSHKPLVPMPMLLDIEVKTEKND